MPIDISTLKPFWSNTSHYQIQFLYMLKFSKLFVNNSRLASNPIFMKCRNVRSFWRGFETKQQIDVYKSNFLILRFFRQENLDIGGFLVQLQNHRSLRQDLLQ